MPGVRASLRPIHPGKAVIMRCLILTCCLTAAPAFAEDAVLSIAQDRYQAGPSVRSAGPVVSDLFMAGNEVVVAAPVAGSAHLAGRRVTVEAAVAEDLFAAGYGLDVSGAVGAMPRSQVLK